MHGVRFVYALSDPRKPRAVRYVGCASDIALRLQQHLLEAARRDDYKNPAKCAWLRQLIQDGVEPLLAVLETVPEDGDWIRREQHWIDVFRSPALTNFRKPPATPRPRVVMRGIVD